MGVWGPANFDNDTAFCFANDAVIKPMIAQLRRVVDNPRLADPEEDASFKIMAAAEILAVLCEQLPVPPPPTELVEDCRDLCLRGWDEGIDKLEPEPRYKEERRAAIAATFERLLKASRDWEPQLMAAGHPLIVGSEELIPDEELARMAAALETALSTANVGTVGARATFPEPKFWSLRSIIHVTVSDLEAGVEVLARALRSVDAPMPTWIWKGGPKGRAEVIYEVWTGTGQDQA
jgi:hypothetical protein